MAGGVASQGGRSAGQNRFIITASIMAATLMNSLDTTIANVALPHIQGSVSASQDQITWVLTSYIVAAAIMTPLTGWLAGTDRAKVGVHDLHRRVHRRLGPVRHLQFSSGDRAVPAFAGHVRRGAGAFVAGGAARHQPAGKARPGHGRMGRRRHSRTDPGAGAGRLSHRQPLLALGFLHQPAHRHPGLSGRLLFHPGA